jgi:hypothetical protein
MKRDNNEARPQATGIIASLWTPHSLGTVHAAAPALG